MLDLFMFAASAASADGGCFQDSDTITPPQRGSRSKT
jgi:hypothetical protein